MKNARCTHVPTLDQLMAGPRGRRFLYELSRIWTRNETIHPEQPTLEELVHQALAATAAAGEQALCTLEPDDLNDQLADPSSDQRAELLAIADQLVEELTGHTGFGPLRKQSGLYLQKVPTSPFRGNSENLGSLNPRHALLIARQQQGEAELEAMEFEGIPSAELVHRSEGWSSTPAVVHYTTAWKPQTSGENERSVSRLPRVADQLEVFEIASVQDWVGLCRRFPVDVTGQKRPDWYRATGREGRWVIPDWAAVAEEYDGVHLQTGVYLQAAGVALAVHEQRGTATLIAGWAPDATYWFTTDLGYGQLSSTSS